MYSIQHWKKLFTLWSSSPEIVEISHHMLFLSSSRMYSCNQIMLLQSQKYGCHLWSQLQQFYGPSCNVFKMFVASASRLEDFLGALTSLARIASKFSSVSTVCFLSELSVLLQCCCFRLTHQICCCGCPENWHWQDSYLQYSCTKNRQRT